MSGEQFEHEVRSIARALWNAVPGQGAAEIVDGRERDCIFKEEYLTHYIECTEKRTLEKLKYDAEKMVRYRDKQQKLGSPVKLWFVTLHEPTGDQRTFGRNNGIDVLSLEEFRRRIIDATGYLELRRNYPFGSATDPETDSPDLSSVKYEPVAIRSGSDEDNADVDTVVERLIHKGVVLLLGDYGMGKSITVRETFLKLRSRYLNTDGNSPVPIVLNLREHWGQMDPSEALLRHAERIGFSNPSQLVRALHAGRLIIILDGFDELGGQGWVTGASDKLRNLRANAVRLIKQFVTICRGKNGVLVTGREHYFDSRTELVSALNIRNEDPVFFLDEFSDREAKAYLRKRGVSHELPEWLPKRPVLLASLVGKNLLDAVLLSSDIHDPAMGWDRLIDLVCEREAAIHELLGAKAIRHILEYIASHSRTTPSGIGPITEDHLAEAYRREIGSYPDAPARMLLQRLPGLSARNREDGSRLFLDDQLLDVLRAGDVYRFIENPWENPSAKGWVHGIGELGATVAYGLCLASGRRSHAEFVTASNEAALRWSSATLAMDVILAEWNGTDSELNLNWSDLEINGADIHTMDFSKLAAIEHLVISDSVINIVVGPDVSPVGVRIKDSILRKVIGYPNEQSLPAWMSTCEVQEFDGRESNAELMRKENLPIGVRVLGTVLRKLYLQAGQGRRENALYRGLGRGAQNYVQDVLEILRKNKLAYPTARGGQNIWHQLSNQRSRAVGILDRLSDSEDPVVVASKALGR